MNRINPADLPNLARRYRFQNARLRSVAWRYRRGGLSLTIVLRASAPDGRKVKLRLLLENVEEHRWQKRPSFSAGTVKEFRAAYLQGRVYVSFDSLGLAPNETPGLHDFRASELFAGGEILSMEEVVPTPPPGNTAS